MCMAACASGGVVKKECRNKGVTVLCRWKSRVKTSRCWPQRARCSWASRSRRLPRSPWRPWKATSGPSSPTWLWRWDSGGSGGFFTPLPPSTAVFSRNRLFASLAGNLQGQEEVLWAGVQGGLFRPGQHGHQRGQLHSEGRPWRPGQPTRPQNFTLFNQCFFFGNHCQFWGSLKKE